MSEAYLSRFSKKLLVEMEEFLTGQQMITACLLAIAAFWYQYRSGKLSWILFKENATSVIYPFVWVVCGFGCYYVVKAGIHLHREMIDEANAYQPAIPGFRHPRPSPVAGIVTAAGCLTILWLLSYFTFRAAFPSNGVDAVVIAPAGLPTPQPSPQPPQVNPDNIADLVVQKLRPRSWVNLSFLRAEPLPGIEVKSNAFFVQLSVDVTPPVAATNVVKWYKVEYADHVLSKNEEEKRFQSAKQTEKRVGPVSLSPGSHAIVLINPKYSQAEHDNLKDLTTAVYAFGDITYQDGETEFCFRISPSLPSSRVPWVVINCVRNSLMK